MTILLLTLLLLSLAYLVLMLTYSYGFKQLQSWETPGHYRPTTTVTVVVPARNEAHNILRCVQAIAEQNYPPGLFEIIVIDDHSTDNTAKLLKDSAIANLTVLHLKDYLESDEQIVAYKKKAIEMAIAHSDGKLIVTTDADCAMGPNWLQSLVSYYECHSPKLIAAPVRFVDSQGCFQKFQALDFIGMIGLTAASICLKIGNMSNGANLAYERDVFQEMLGFKGIDHIASGDDMLFMQKIARYYPEGIHFLKSREAVVSTFPERSLQAFVQQRKRWASKSAAYKDKRVTLALAMVLMFCTAIVLLLFLSLWYPSLLQFALPMLLLKTLVDFIFLRQVSRYFGQASLMRTFLISQLFHIIYIVSVGFWSQIGQYKWKGRQLK